MAVSPAWRVPAHSLFLWRVWDEEHVLYHVNSGDTHRLNAVGARALHLLVAGPLTSAELAAQLTSEFTGEPDAAMLATAEDLVERLRTLGLVEPDA